MRPDAAVHLLIWIEPFVVIDQLRPNERRKRESHQPAYECALMNYVKMRPHAGRNCASATLCNVESSRRHFGRLVVAKRYPSRARLAQRFSDAAYIFTAFEVCGLVKRHQCQVCAHRGQSLYSRQYERLTERFSRSPIDNVKNLGL